MAIKKFTINDIAQEAKVSKTTVSRVMNCPEKVNDITRKKIEKIMKKRKYVPSQNARNLSMQLSTTIGVIIPEIDNPFWGAVLRCIAKKLDERKMTFICFSAYDDEKKDTLALERFKEIGVAGLLYTPAIDYSSQSEIISLLQQLDVPIVVMDRDVEALKMFDGVFFRDREAIFQAAEILMEAGCKTIGMMNADVCTTLGRTRRQGYIDALEKHNIKCIDQYYYNTVDYFTESAYRVAMEMLDSGEIPDGMITGNNSISLGLLKALKKHGMHWNREIRCISLDKIEPMDIILDNFDYIDRPPEEIGNSAINLLIEKIAFPKSETRHVYLTPKICIQNL